MGYLIVPDDSVAHPSISVGNLLDFFKKLSPVLGPLGPADNSVTNFSFIHLVPTTEVCVEAIAIRYPQATTAQLVN